jgi:glutaconate CoA-transferase, subunit A
LVAQPSKVMTTKEAIDKFVHNGDKVVLANFCGPLAYTLTHETIRQQKKDLTVISPTCQDETDQMVAAGCVRRMITSFFYRYSPETYDSPFERNLRAKKLELEEYTNWLVSARLTAGAMGLPFFPLKGASIMASDIFKKRGFEGENKFKVIENPFDRSQKSVLVPALTADVAFLHVAQADETGNAQLWGPLGPTKMAALACDKIVVTAEKIVPKDIIYRNPNLTIIPGFRTSAVIEEPWGGHPTYFAGHYDSDFRFGMMWYLAGTPDKQQDYLKEWVYGVDGRSGYIKHYIEKYGEQNLTRLKSKEYPSIPVNLGSSLFTIKEMFEITDEQMAGSPDLFDIEV